MDKTNVKIIQEMKDKKLLGESLKLQCQA